ncbi:MAG: hypothetical protein VX498_10005 [Myxococcota bacterium]|nr:hypothetical protein [Myxococcota bacterium]
MNEVRAQVVALIELDRLDGLRYRCQVELAATPRALAQQSSELDALAGRRDGSQKDLDDSRKRLTSGEAELQALERRRLRAQERMPLLQTSTQIEATQREIGALQTEIADLEGDLLEVMEQIDQLQDSVREQTAAVESAVSELAEDQGRWELRQAALNAEVARLEEERAPLVSDLRSDLLRRYQLGWNQKRATAPSGLTRVDGQVCVTCHTSLSPRWVQDAQSYRAIPTCDSCKRIVVFDPASEGEAEESLTSP